VTLLTCISVFAVPGAGVLFEWFVLLYLPKEQVRRFKKACRNVGDKTFVEIDPGEFEYFKDTYSMKFAGFIFYSLLQQGTACQRQTFYVNFALRYHGLSRFGTAVLGKLGYGLPLTTVDRWSVILQDEQLLRLM
jgi:hypothetical protein